jgi:hypothetical protein
MFSLLIFINPNECHINIPPSTFHYHSFPHTHQLTHTKISLIFLPNTHPSLSHLNVDKPKDDKTFAEKLSAQIINNVQIKISDIHIRYEDNVSCSTPFACGITLSNFSVHTTDEAWNKTLVSQSLLEIYKVAQLESLAVYMNCDCKLFQEYSSDNYITMFKESIATRTMTSFSVQLIRKQN